MITKIMNEEELESLPYIERTKIELAESVKKCSDLTNELSKKDEKIAKLEALLISNNIVF